VHSDLARWRRLAYTPGEEITLAAGFMKHGRAPNWFRRGLQRHLFSILTG
jgi:hypothetical protein